MAREIVLPSKFEILADAERNVRGAQARYQLALRAFRHAIGEAERGAARETVNAEARSVAEAKKELDYCRMEVAQM